MTYKNESKYQLAMQEYLNDETVTLTYLSKKYGFDRNCFSNYLKRNNINIKLRGRSTQKELILQKSISLYEDGNSIRQISKKLGVTEKSISSYLKQHNINVKQPKFNNIEYHFNENFFRKIDNEMNAYWFGFIMADGYVRTTSKSYRLGITLNNIDKDHLQKFLNNIGSNHLIKTRIRYEREYSEISINSKTMIFDLIDKGCIPKKTYNGFIGENVLCSLNEKIAFLRGFLDGDGFISKNRYNIVYTIKSKQIAESVFEMIKELGVESKLYLDNKNLYRISIYNKLNFFKLLSLLYDNANIYLDRKYAIYKARISSLL
jgi:intein/homing endonuclease